jgi:hypothetical protein
MTTQTPRSQRDSSETARLDDLLRADAAAVIDDDLDDEASYQEFSATDSRTGGPAMAAQRPRSQVYSIRVPVEQLEQLRRLAKDRGLAPTAMLREWALVQLEAEIGTRVQKAQDSSPEAVKHSTTREGSSTGRQETTTERLERAAALLTDVTAQQTKMVALWTERVTMQGTSAAQPAVGVHMLPAYSGPLAASAWRTYSGSSLPLRVWTTTLSGRPEATCETTQSTIRYVLKGLADLRSTVEDTSSLPGFSNIDLDTLYGAADDELSYP